MPRNLRAILFDFGDTLVDFGPFNTTALFRAGGRLAYDRLRSLGQPLPGFRWYFLKRFWAVRWRYFLGHLTRREFDALDLITRLGRRMGHSLSDEQLAEVAWLWYKPLRDHGKVEPGVPDVLQSLRDAGMKLGIVSNTFVSGRILDRHLREEGIERYFPVRVYSADVGRRKPHRRIFEVALERLGVSGEETMFVGDSVRADVKGAARLGMIAVLKSPGVGARLPRAARHRVRSLLELPALLRQYGVGASSDAASP